MERVIYAFLMLGLTGCVSFQDPVPEGYLGPTAVVEDTYENHEGSTAHFFTLTKVNGVAVEHSAYRTRVRNSGQGFDMTPYMVSREVTADPQVFTIAGLVQFATDAQAMFGDQMLVEGDIEITPSANQTYRVVGELGKSGSEVWIVDSNEELVGEKVKTAE